MKKRKPPCHESCKQGRHVFTREECQRGYQRACEKLREAHPDWKCLHGKHLSHCLLRAKNPAWYAMQRVITDLEQQVAHIEQRLGTESRNLQSIKQELALLKSKGSTYDGPLRQQLGEFGVIDESTLAH